MPIPTPPQPDAAVADPRAAWQLWILTIWHPAVGMAVDPVAVLALDSADGAAPARYLTWVPLVYDEANSWRERLAEEVTPELLHAWAQESGACQIAPAEIPDEALDLAHAAEIILDQLLAEVIPALPPRSGS